MSAIWRGRIVIGCIVVCLVAASAAGPAPAGCISQTFGNTTIHNCDGKISASHTVGETTVHNFDGKLGTSQTVGNTTVHNLGNKLGTSHTVGTTTMHNFYGKFGWSQRFSALRTRSARPPAAARRSSWTFFNPIRAFARHQHVALGPEDMLDAEFLRQIRLVAEIRQYRRT